MIPILSMWKIGGVGGWGRKNKGGRSDSRLRYMYYVTGGIE